MTSSTSYVCRLSRRPRDVLGYATEINLNDIETPLYLLSYTTETRVGGAVLETYHECLPLPKDLNLAHRFFEHAGHNNAPFLTNQECEGNTKRFKQSIFFKIVLELLWN